MYLMTRLKTDKDGLGVKDMVDFLNDEGFDATETVHKGWNVVVLGIHNQDEEQYVWQLAEEQGCYGYVPSEYVYG